MAAAMADRSTPTSSFSGTSDADGSFSSFHSSESTLDGNHDFLGSYFQSTASQEAMNRSDPALSMATKGSTSTMYQSAVSNRSPGRRLRSQYPADSTEKHVEYILASGFDIDRGPMMEFQYPTAISEDGQMLAELMLPDQAHNRSQDWTTFFLHKETEVEGQDDEDPIAEMRRKRRSRQSQKNGETGTNGDGSNPDLELEPTEDSDEEDTEKLIEGPPLIYVLNLVNTKHDTSVRRGGIVKSMAICTRHPFVHIYKPLLLLALDEYFKTPTLETLATLYDAVNTMDLSLMPRLSLLERNILQSSTAKDMFIEKFAQMIRQKEAEDMALEAASSPSGEVNEALTPTGRYGLPRDTHSYETKVVYHGVAVPIKVPTARSPETVGDFSIIKLIQTFTAPHAQSPQPFTLHPHLTTGGANTHPIIVLVNALLTQKRIVFTGHNMPSGEVADAVLAACALASGGTLRGFTRHAFPYTDLAKIDALLNVPGFVAGVMNPTFANKPEWWDLLCDLPTGRMKISPNLEQPPITDGIQAFQQQNPTVLTPANILSFQTQDVTGDAAFMESVQRNISNRLGEGVIRTMWRDWILKFVRVAAAFEESIYGESPLSMGLGQADEGTFGVKGHGYVWGDDNARVRELAANINRIEGWRPTRTYFSLKHDQALLQICRPITSIDLNYHHDRLRTQKLGRDESAAIYLAFERAIRSASEINQILTVMPESHGGLFYISLGLLHPRKDVRARTVLLLERIQTHEAGRHFWNGSSRFTQTAFYRIRKELAQAASQNGNGDDELSRTTTLLSQTNLASA